ncbi:glycosyltransferase family 2 protein [Microbacterium tumbae]
MPVPTISIVVPVFNARDYVEFALRRLLSQGAAPLEVIVVDDCSSDGTAESVRRVAASDNRVRVIELAENGGVAHARNTALSFARGKFVWFVDIDDEWSDLFLTVMLEAILVADADLAVCSAVHRYGPLLKEEEFVIRYRRNETLVGNDALKCILLGTGALWNKLFRRECLGESPFPTLRSKSDHGGLLRIMLSLKRVATVPDSLYTYVQRDGSISNGGVPQPQNFLALLSIADESLSGRDGIASLVSRFRCMIVARALRECWRFAGEANELILKLRGMVGWRDIIHAAADGRSFITCAAAKISPTLARTAFRRLGRGRWTAHGGAQMSRL